MKKRTYILAGVALTALSLGAQAQTQPNDTTLARTVVVEQEYNPDIMDAAKVNVLPKVEPPTAGKRDVEYDATLMPATHIPAGILQAYPGVEVQPKAQPGYVRLGYGNYGNLDIRANYLFAFSPQDRLNLTFAMDGMDGKLDLPNEEGGKWNSFYYRSHAGIDYVHAFRKVDLNVAGKFDHSNFNLQPGSIRSKQEFTSGSVHFGVASTDDDMPIRFRAETNALLYLRQSGFPTNNAKEGIARTKADVAGTISDKQRVGLAFAMNNVFYGDGAFENYTYTDFNPYYLFQNNDWKIRLGAHVDLAFGFGKTFRAAPDVTAEYTFSNSYTLYAQAKGGRLQNDFQRLEMLNPYGLITDQPDATYEQVNAALGFKASPATGFWFHLYGGYQNLRDDLAFFPDLSYQGAFLHAAQAATDNLYAGADISYDYKDLIGFYASGVYRNWSTDSDKESATKAEMKMLAFKPALEADFRMDLRPIPAVTVSIGYQHIARQEVEGNKADPVSNLYLSGSYELFKGIAVYARANNLLNKDYQYYRGCPAEGINFLGGVSFKF